MAWPAPGQYKTLNVLDLAANGASTYAMTLLFSDGSTDAVTANSAGGNTVTDWISGTTNLAFKGIGRINRSTGGGYSGAGTSPNLQEQDFSLSSGDQAKTLTAITFKQTSGNTLGILAVSGINFGSGFNVYPNNVVVSANSTLDVPNGPMVMGNLKITGAGLTVTSSSSTASSLSLGTTVVSGATSFSPAANVTLNLATVANGAAASTITIGGAGTTNIPNVPSGVTLTGAGTVGNLVTVASGGAVDAPSVAGAGTASTITTQNGITFASGSTYNVKLGGTTPGSYDSIANTGGTVTLTGATLGAPTALSLA